MISSEVVGYIVRSERLHRSRQRRRAGILAALTIAACVAAVLASIQSSVASRHAREATTARRDAEKLVDFMGTDLKSKLESVGRIELLENAATEIEDYYRGRPGESSFGDIARQSAAVELRGEAYIATGRYEEAGELFETQIFELNSLKEKGGRKDEFTLIIAR